MRSDILTGTTTKARAFCEEGEFALAEEGEFALEIYVLQLEVAPGGTRDNVTANDCVRYHSRCYQVALFTLSSSVRPVRN